MRATSISFILGLCLATLQLVACDDLLSEAEEKEDEENSEEGSEEAGGDDPKDQVSAAGICEKYQAKTEGSDEWTQYVATLSEKDGDCVDHLTEMGEEWDQANPDRTGQKIGIYGRCLDKRTTVDEFTECLERDLGDLSEARGSSQGRRSGAHKARRGPKTAGPKAKKMPRANTPARKK